MYFHVWFVTKYRKATLEDTAEKFVKSIFAECIQRHGYRVLELESNKDHIHMLVDAENRKELSAIVRTLKAVSAKEILGTPRFRVGNVQHFWARRYGYKEVSLQDLSLLREYIRKQKEIPHNSEFRNSV